ncbi:MAG: hypothetical protein BGN92_03860 [Sphingobacteriales bacterium 41-5]|nr:MAG: hypothetical protein BGN92_03860 [Sphingobacteriales bacterium 41-5]
MQTIEKVLYLLSEFFYIPVVATLFLLLAFLTFSLGEFLAEALRRTKNKNYYIAAKLQEMQPAKDMSSPEAEAMLEHIIHEQQNPNTRKINAARYCVKIGPTAGLIGTLTPMAKALAGLSEGNLNSLSGQMITAFSTTVLGLIIGGIAYSVAHVRIKWQKHDRYKLGVEAENIFKKSKELKSVS